MKCRHSQCACARALTVFCAQVIQSSTALDGQAVVVLFRALCAVSREELEMGEPRVYCLEELVACAWHNIGAPAAAVRVWGRALGAGNVRGWARVLRMRHDMTWHLFWPLGPDV